MKGMGANLTNGAAIAMLLLAACASPEPPAAVDSSSGKVTVPTNAVNATVKFVNLEGGCWAIVPDGSTQQYQPTNLPQEHRVDGRKVRVKFHELNDMMSICMIGPIVQIDEISAAP